MIDFKFDDITGNADAEYQERFKELYLELGEVLRDHLHEGEPSRDKILQALNALAVHVAVIIVGTEDPRSLEFFYDCFDGCLQRFSKDYPDGTDKA
jgi:hypothetical protein